MTEDNRHLAEQVMDQAAPWAFSKDAEPGDEYLGRGDYPDLEVLSNDVVEITKIEVQLLRVRDTDRDQDVLVRRLIGTMSNGKEVDIGERFAVPTALVDQKVDVTTCEACLQKIEKDDLIILDGKAYHQYCADEEL